jgi:glycosyltransferase involved in cell wall biosynthesis
VLARARGPLLSQVPASVRVVDLRTRTAITALPWLARHPVDALRLLRRPSMVYNLPFVFGSIPALARYLRRERPDAMLSALNYGNLAAIFARHVAHSPTRLAVSEHNPLSVRVAKETQRRMRTLPASVGHFYRWADGIGAVSQGVADDLAATARLPRSSIRVTYNPVVTPELHAEAEQPLAHPWFAPGAPPVVIGAGRLQPQKDFANLIRAFARVRAQRPLRLLILGQGPLRAELEALARELGVGADVELHGFAPNRLAFMRRAGLFVLSSAWEGLPTVLIEALACGCPVVSTDCPSGPAEILDGGRYGGLAPTGDPAALARVMAAALDAPPAPEARLARLARAGLYSTAASADRYLALMLGEPDPTGPTKLPA